jgi:catechol 2,3-dioxygenase-like lactoylglutathione lyase family enzyme
MIDRRELLVGMGGVLAIGAGTLRAEESLFHARELNHVALRATDPERTARFYERVLGATRIDDGPPSSRFMAIGRHVVNLFQGPEPVLDHFCFTIDGYQPEAAAARLRAAGITPTLQGGRLYFLDPDGFKLQIGGPNAGGQKF